MKIDWSLESPRCGTERSTIYGNCGNGDQNQGRALRLPSQFEGNSIKCCAWPDIRVYRKSSQISS